MVQASSLSIGKHFCPGYQLKGLRGRGGYGSVWEAQTEDGQLVALKFLKSVENSSAAQEIRAIQTVSRLRHPHLTGVNTVFAHRGYIVVAMPLADGSLLDLDEAYRTEVKTPIPAAELCRLLGQGASALDFLNTRQHVVDGVRIAIQHCDVKPSNFLVFGDTLSLCDFSLSSVTTSAVKAHRRAGTLDYAAPEVFQGRLSDTTDQYSLAITYCFLRGGRLPFADTPRNFDRGYVRPTPDLTMLPPAERTIVARALSPVPVERWPSCAELIAQLTRAVGKSV